MKNRIKKSDFDFEYTGNNYGEKDIIKNGYLPLSADELLSRIKNTTIFGDYIMGYKFITDIYENGTAEGINDAGSYDIGSWVIDYEKHTLQLVWQNGWIDTLTRAYDVNGNIEFYDVNTGNWRTTFKKFRNQ